MTTQPISVTEPSRGVYQVHASDQNPVEGVAVYSYHYGWSCEECGAPSRHTRGPCVHIRAVEKSEKEKT